MTLLQQITDRSGDACELCGKNESLVAHCLAPYNDEEVDHHVHTCAAHVPQIDGAEPADAAYWGNVLPDAIWSPTPAVQVISYRLLKSLQGQPWSQSLLDQLYLDDATTAWAENTGLSSVVHKDCNGNVISKGDSVTLIQDLDVKGANFAAKRGTLVKNVRLVEGNAEQIEGKVNDQLIVILTKYTRKA
jgi:protein PhnA